MTFYGKCEESVLRGMQGRGRGLSGTFQEVLESSVLHDRLSWAASLPVLWGLRGLGIDVTLSIIPEVIQMTVKGILN